MLPVAKFPLLPKTWRYVCSAGIQVETSTPFFAVALVLTKHLWTWTLTRSGDFAQLEKQ